MKPLLFKPLVLRSRYYGALFFQVELGKLRLNYTQGDCYEHVRVYKHPAVI